MGGKTLLNYCFRTPFAQESKTSILPYLPFKPFTIPIRYLYKIIYLLLPYSTLYIYIYIYIYYLWSLLAV